MFICWRWEVIGRLPELKKYVIVSAPHQKKIEIPLGFAVGEIQNAPQYKFFVKHEVQDWPLIGSLLLKIGMIPVIRTSDESKRLGITRRQYINEAVSEFKKNDEMVYAVAPEGTTKWKGFKNSPEWQKGFYETALKADVPIVLIAFVHEPEAESIVEQWIPLLRRKKILISRPMYMTSDINKDRETIIEWYKCVPGYKPNILEKNFIFK